MFKLIDDDRKDPADIIIKVLGVGRAGCNVLKGLKVEDVEKIYIGKDNFLISEIKDNSSIPLILAGKQHSSNGNPNSGYLLAKENDGLLRAHIKGADIIFIIAGLGGETGGGASQYIAQIIKEEKALSIGMFSMPFTFEGDRKTKIAKNTYSKLHMNVDSLITIENDSHLDFLSNTNSKSIFFESTYIFQSLIFGMVSLITKPGLINVDLDDVIVAMGNMGKATIGTGISSGENRAENAAKSALSSKFFKDIDLTAARGVLVNITAGMDISIDEFEAIGNAVKEFASDGATIVVGAVIDIEIKDDLQVIIITSGVPEEHEEIGLIDEAEIYRTIEFSTENISAGLSILSYFDQVLKQKYKDIIATVRIEQNNSSVRLVIETNNGDVETIEKTLNDYGMVVKGELKASEFLSNSIDIERLNMKLEIASMELRHNQNIIALYETELGGNKNRIENLELQVTKLQDSLGDSLINTQNNLSSTLNRGDRLVSSVIELVQEYSNNGFTKDDELLLKAKVEEAHQYDKTITSELESLLKNTIYGVSGNSVFMFIQSLIQTLPK